MTVSAASIIKDAMRRMNDVAGERTSVSEFVSYLNQAQADIRNVRPDLTSVIAPFALEVGARQRIPINAASLIDIPSNLGGTLASIQKTELSLLDAYEPSWRSMTPSDEIKHFAFDPRNPRVFWVYPPAVASTLVELEASAYPTEIADPGVTSDPDDVTGNMSFADEWRTAVLFMVLYHAYTADLEGVTNVALAAGFKGQAEAILGVQLQTSVSAIKEE